MSRGLFVTLEGIEGCGKTTQADLLSERVSEYGLEAVRTFEPGGTPVGDAIRAVVKDGPLGQEMCAETEMLLFAASRAELVRRVVVPSVARGAVVICDRFLDSTRVYQGNGRGLPSVAIEDVNAFASAGVQPDITVLLDIRTEVSVERLKTRNGADGAQLDRIEQESVEFHERIRNGYLELAARFPERIQRVDAEGAVADVSDLIWEIIERAVNR